MTEPRRRIDQSLHLKLLFSAPRQQKKEKIAKKEVAQRQFERRDLHPGCINLVSERLRSP